VSSKSSPSRTCHLTITKNGSTRNIPLSNCAVETLSKLPNNLSGIVFFLSPVALRGLWCRACKRASINGLRFHDPRDKATSRFFEKGLNVMGNIGTLWKYGLKQTPCSALRSNGSAPDVIEAEQGAIILKSLRLNGPSKA
jgi:hypothetical protein